MAGMRLGFNYAHPDTMRLMRDRVAYDAMMKTCINCYSNNAETLDALMEKLMGRDTFRGVSPVDPFCGKDYLRY